MAKAQRSKPKASSAALSPQMQALMDRIAQLERKKSPYPPPCPAPEPVFRIEEPGLKFVTANTDCCHQAAGHQGLVANLPIGSSPDYSKDSMTAKKLQDLDAAVDRLSSACHTLVARLQTVVRDPTSHDVKLAYDNSAPKPVMSKLCQELDRIESRVHFMAQFLVDSADNLDL